MATKNKLTEAQNHNLRLLRDAGRVTYTRAGYVGVDGKPVRGFNAVALASLVSMGLVVRTERAGTWGVFERADHALVTVKAASPEPAGERIPSRDSITNHPQDPAEVQLAEQLVDEHSELQWIPTVTDETNPNDAESARRDRGLPARDGTSK